MLPAELERVWNWIQSNPNATKDQFMASLQQDVNEFVGKVYIELSYKPVNFYCATVMEKKYLDIIKKLDLCIHIDVTYTIPFNQLMSSIVDDPHMIARCVSMHRISEHSQVRMIIARLKLFESCVLVDRNGVGVLIPRDAANSISQSQQHTLKGAKIISWPEKPPLVDIDIYDRFSDAINLSGRLIESVYANKNSSK